MLFVLWWGVIIKSGIYLRWKTVGLIRFLPAAIVCSSHSGCWDVLFCLHITARFGELCRHYPVA